MMDLAPAIAIIKQFEGCELTAYKDTGGVWTIGYGRTKDVYEGEVITQSQAEMFLEEDLQEFAQNVGDMVRVPLTDNEFCALVSFDFNVGPGNLHGSTLLKMLNAGDPKQMVADQLLRWVYDSQGHFEQGLANRRKAERELFLTPDIAPLAS